MTHFGATSHDAQLAQRLISMSLLPVLLLDGDMRVVFASRSFCSSFESDGPPEGRLLSELGLGEWNVPQLQSLLEVALGEGPPIDCYEMDLKRPDAAVRHLRLNARKVGFGGATDDRVLLTADDVTEAHRIARANRDLVTERDALLREKVQAISDRNLLLSEMRHRIANSLQIIASIMILKARGVQSDESRMHLQDAYDRVLTIANIQEQLCEGLVDLEVGSYLTNLCNSLSASMIREYRPITLTVDADATVLDPHVAVSLGLVVTELVINALKHAFPGNRSGKVVVRYRNAPDGWALSVEDDGVGMPDKAATAHVGLGSSLVAALARQMDAEVSVTNAEPGTKTVLLGRRFAASSVTAAVRPA